MKRGAAVSCKLFVCTVLVGDSVHFGVSTEQRIEGKCPTLTIVVGFADNENVFEERDECEGVND